MVCAAISKFRGAPCCDANGTLGIPNNFPVIISNCLTPRGIASKI